MGKLELNSTMLELKKSEGAGFKTFALCYLLYIAVMVIFQIIFRGSQQIVGVLAGYFAAMPVCVGFMVKVGKRSFASLGMSKEKFLLRYCAGWLVSLVMLAIVWGINILLGGVSFQFNKNFNITVFLMLLAEFVVQGFMEEFLLRSLLFTQIAVKWGMAAGIISNSIIFGLGHISNSGASAISLINTVLIGTFASLIFYYYDNVWLVSGFHSGWNFILGPVFGIIVSGFAQPTSVLLTEADMNQTILNGGRYGFEAGLPVTVISILLIVIYWVKIIRKPKAVPG